MAYNTNNPPQRIRGSVDGGVSAVWSYVSANSLTQVAAAGFITDAANLGMKVGDIVFVAENDNNYATDVFSVASITAGAASLSRSATLQTEAGAGITNGVGTLYASSVQQVGGLIETKIIIDITGLNCGGTANDIIGTNGTGKAHLGRIVAARNGTIIGGTMVCLETPAGGGTDIDLYSADEDTGVEDTLVTALTETQLINAGVASAGASDPFGAMPAAGQYLYLANVDGSNATYTAGVFLITMWGIPV
jgi:hypothetical protein